LAVIRVGRSRLREDRVRINDANSRLHSQERVRCACGIGGSTLEVIWYKTKRDVLDLIKVVHRRILVPNARLSNNLSRRALGNGTIWIQTDVGVSRSIGIHSQYIL